MRVTKCITIEDLCPLHDLGRRESCTCPPLCPDSPDGNHHVAEIGSEEEHMPSKSPCYYCGDKQILLTDNR